MTKKNKTVEASFFTNRAKNANKKEVYYFNEQDYIEYYPKFSKSKKDALILELVNTVEYCKNNNIKDLRNNSEVQQYTYYLIIKYFTSLYDTLSKWNVEDNIAYMYALYESGDFELFFDEIFTYEEVQKVIDMLFAIEEMATLYAKDVALRNKKLEESIQSDYIKEKLKNNEILN